MSSESTPDPIDTPTSPGKNAPEPVAQGLESVATGLQNGLESIGGGLQNGLSGGLTVTLKEKTPEGSIASQEANLKVAQVFQAWATVGFLILGGIGLGVVGAIATYTFNQAQTRIGARQNEISQRGTELSEFQANVVAKQAETAEQKRVSDERLKTIELVESFIPHLEVDGPRRKAALLTIWRLSDTELMLELALLFGGEGAADALSELAHRNPELPLFGRARTTYEAVVGASPELALPNVRFVPEERTRSVSVTVNVPETRTATYKVAKMVSSTESRLVVQQDIEGKIIRDEQGQPAITKEEYQVTVPVYEEVEREYSVTVPQMKTRDIRYTVLVPHLMEETTGDFVGSRLADIFADGPQRTDTVLSELLSSLSIPPDESRLVSNLRRELMWRTKAVPGTDLVKLNDREVIPVMTAALPIDMSPEYPKRIWHFNSEREPVEGVFVSQDSGEVVLRVDNEGLIGISIDEFSFNDREWLTYATQEQLSIDPADPVPHFDPPSAPLSPAPQTLPPPAPAPQT